MKRSSRTKLRLALIALVSASPSFSAITLGNETDKTVATKTNQPNFIVQPSLRPRIVTPPAPALSPSATTAQNSSLASSLDRQIEQPNEALTSEPPAARSFASENAVPAARVGFIQSAPPQGATFTHTSQPELSSSSGSALRWQRRGSFPSQANSHDAVPGNSSPLSVGAKPQAKLKFEQPNVQPKTVDVPEPTAQVPQITLAVERAEPSELEVELISQAKEKQKSRIELASRVSRNILGSRQQADSEFQSVASYPGWQAVGERLSTNLASCDSLLRRRAFFSAREEAEKAALYLMQILDLVNGAYEAEPEWQAAQTALREAEDFLTVPRLSNENDSLRSLVGAHETTALKNVSLVNVSPLAARQHYYQVAIQHLVAAAQSHPWASDVYYSLGRASQAQAESESSEKRTSLQWQATTYYRAAVAVSPDNSLAANQLGFILLQMDRATEAREVLVGSLNAKPTIPALENIVEASRRLQDGETQRWALQYLAALKQNQPAAQGPAITELQPYEFAAMSPYTIGPQPTQAPILTATPGNALTR